MDIKNEKFLSDLTALMLHFVNIHLPKYFVVMEGCCSTGMKSGERSEEKN